MENKMKANELRIGNWVSTIYGMEFQVYPMAFKQMPTDEKHNLILNTWKPIPLTEKWMLELGFEDGEEGHYYINKFIINIYGEVYWGDSEEWLGELQYVHQLQNLYFAITGEELTIGGDNE